RLAVRGAQLLRRVVVRAACERAVCPFAKAARDDGDCARAVLRSALAVDAHDAVRGRPRRPTALRLAQGHAAKRLLRPARTRPRLAQPLAQSRLSVAVARALSG